HLFFAPLKNLACPLAFLDWLRLAVVDPALHRFHGLVDGFFECKSALSNVRIVTRNRDLKFARLIVRSACPDFPETNVRLYDTVMKLVESRHLFVGVSLDFLCRLEFGCL